tara:strand:+ start:108 stop:779 length:672 start_codon:yes stop_codon:yes gene_type:complete
MISDFKECKFLIDYVENYCPNLLTWKEFADLINIRPLLTQERVKLLDPKKRIFKWYTHGWMKDVNTYPPSLIRSLLDEIVIYLSDMSRSTKNINDFASFLEDQYERHIDAHIYVCRDPNIEHPFAAHFDMQHNVIVQCEGKTNFKVWKEVEDHSIEKQIQLDMSNEEPILDVIMEVGDAIWIPRYYPHQAISLTPRLSVSFPFNDTENTAHKDHFEDRNWVTL